MAPLPVLGRGRPLLGYLVPPRRVDGITRHHECVRSGPARRSIRSYRNGQYEQARAALGLVVGSGWRELLTLRFIARVKEPLGNLNATATWLLAAAEIDRTTPRCTAIWAMLCASLATWMKPTVPTGRAVDRDPRLTSAYGGMVHALHLATHDAQALACAENLLRHTATADAYRSAGTTLVWLNRHEDAIERFRTAQILCPDDAMSPWYPTMRLFGQPKSGDWDSVIAAVARALDELAEP